MHRLLSVLIVDDSESDAKLIVANLQARGYTTTSARVSDAAAMRAALASRVWDLVISDWSLPGFGGLEALSILQHEKMDIPFIIVSGVVDDEQAVDAMRRGAHDYVRKDNLTRLGAAIERETAQARLRKERSKQIEHDERFFNVTPDLFCVVGYEGLIKRVNPAWRAALGWSREELVTKTFTELLHPEDAKDAVGRKARLLSGDETTMSWEARYQHKDGSYRYLQWTASPFAEEQVVYAAARDVTERRNTENALRASQARFARLAESGIISIAVAGFDGGYHEVNDAYARLLGYTREELMSGSTNWVDQTPPEWLAVDASTIELLKRTGVAPPYEKELLRRDGKRVPILIGIAVLDATTCIVFIADLTQQKLAEEALRRSEGLLRHSQKMEALGELAAGVAHEINTPAQFVTDNLAFLQSALGPLVDALRPMSVMVEEAKEGRVASDTIIQVEAALAAADVDFVVEQAPRAIEQSLEGIRRVSRIVNAMKSFSHRSSAQKKRTDLREIVETTLNVTRNGWKYVADVETVFDPALPLVSCLRDELSQVLLNLIVNASDSVSDRTHEGADGKGTITITARPDGEWVELRVADTGTGIPERIRSRVFDPFFTTKAVGKGSGQGLAIAHAVVVDKHGGQISFETQEGKGTTFVIRIPIGDPKVSLQPENIPAPVALA